jgi:methylmalonyl-CoA epimerase
LQFDGNFISRDISRTFQIFQDIFGAERLSGPFLDRKQQVNEILIKLGGEVIQLFEPISESSPAFKFLQKRGEGLHHLCYEVADIEEAVAEFRRKGIEVLFEPFPAFEGRQAAFISPFDTANLLVELVEEKKK